MSSFLSSSTSSPHVSTNKYDVFLSFNVEDTRRSFIDHLYRAIVRSEIPAVFRGDRRFQSSRRLKSGEGFTAELFKAIQESWCSVIVLSENYAFSRWCLEELAEIVKQKKERGLRIFPIFYGVEPSELRHQTGSVALAFARFQWRLNKETIQIWRSALTEVANISGWHLAGDRPEAEVIGNISDTIVKTLSATLSLRQTNSNVPYELNEIISTLIKRYSTRGIGEDVIREIIMLLDPNKPADGGTDGCRKIGKLDVYLSKEIAKGSNGTIVLEGLYEGREVAVKRLVGNHDVASKEIENLKALDWHPNIVRYYGVEKDQDFVYLALERCTCSLDDLIQICSDTSQNSDLSKKQSTLAMIENKIGLDFVEGTMRDIKLWKANGHPSSLFLKLMRDIVSGLVCLHNSEIIHRDLKPQNVLLLIKEKTVCTAKLSDMGISKRIPEGRSSLGPHATAGCGTSGWRAPELLIPNGRQTRAVDLFSLGCVLFFCITRGRHPFGDHIVRDANVLNNNRVNLSLLNHTPEAEDLISRLLEPVELRPNALEVLRHPLFWDSDMRLSFLRETSDRVDLLDKNSDILQALERIAPVNDQAGRKWNEKMEPEFIANLGHRRRYNFDSVQDLLRVIRNKLNHYRELPENIQNLVGPLPEGFDGYFASRFPRLFIEVYKVVYSDCREEDCFQKYFKGNVV